MASKHGQKTYIQLLLDPHRAKLLTDMAAENEMRPTAFMRDALYAYLKRALPSSIYGEAEAKDEAVWRESVRNRVKGRKPKEAK